MMICERIGDELETHRVPIVTEQPVEALCQSENPQQALGPSELFCDPIKKLLNESLKAAAVTVLGEEREEI
jgi:hypothetical protein